MSRTTIFLFIVISLLLGCRDDCNEDEMNSSLDSVGVIYNEDVYDYVYSLDTTIIFYNGTLRNKYYPIDDETDMGEYYPGGKLSSYWENKHGDCGVSTRTTFFPNGEEKNRGKYEYNCCNEYRVDTYIDGKHHSRTSNSVDKNPNAFQTVYYSFTQDGEVQLGNQLAFKTATVNNDGEIIDDDFGHTSVYEYDNDGYPVRRTLTHLNGSTKESTYLYY